MPNGANVGMHLPSWAKPRYAVGVNDRNPAAAAPAARERGMPTQAAEPINAADGLWQKRWLRLGHWLHRSSRSASNRGQRVWVAILRPRADLLPQQLSLRRPTRMRCAAFHSMIAPVSLLVFVFVFMFLRSRFTGPAHVGLYLLKSKTVSRGYGEPTLKDLARVIQRFPRHDTDGHARPPTGTARREGSQI
jgi:hypothetical protein